jgi:hypothetical protein
LASYERSASGAAFALRREESSHFVFYLGVHTLE